MNAYLAWIEVGTFEYSVHLNNSGPISKQKVLLYKKPHGEQASLVSKATLTGNLDGKLCIAMYGVSGYLCVFTVRSLVKSIYGSSTLNKMGACKLEMVISLNRRNYRRGFSHTCTY